MTTSQKLIDETTHGSGDHSCDIGELTNLAYGTTDYLLPPPVFREADLLPPAVIFQTLDFSSSQEILFPSYGNYLNNDFFQIDNEPLQYLKLQ